MARPSPRPDICVTTGLVETCDRKIRDNASLSVRCSDSFGDIIPSFTALFLTLAGSMPWPSSVSRISTFLPSVWETVRLMVPLTGFCRALLFSGSSRPWSIAFRKRWVRGFLISSRIRRSISISPPSITRSTSFPCSREISRTILGKVSRRDEKGSMVIFFMSSRRSSTILASVRCCCSASFVRSLISCPRPLIWF